LSRWSAGGTILSAGLLLLSGVGCAAWAPGTEICSHKAGSEETPIEAPSDGEYLLYTQFGSFSPIKTANLRTGDALGFETAQTGAINVLAGQSKWNMTDADMVWKRRD
jgi:hypothetical protein